MSVEAQKGQYKLNLIDKSGDKSVVDLVFEAKPEVFVNWLKKHGRIYAPFYPGISIAVSERLTEIGLVKKAGKLSADIEKNGEIFELE